MNGGRHPVRDFPASRHYGLRTAITHGHSDLGYLFAVNPIRRALAVILVSLGLIGGPLLLPPGDARTVLLLFGVWFGVTGVVMCLPILLWCSIEEAWAWLQRRLWPTVESLDLSPRARNLLRRHGFVTIASVERMPDASLLLLSNMDRRALREIRRSISLWRYRRWQEGGFR